MQSLQHLWLQRFIDLRIAPRMRKLDDDRGRPSTLLHTSSASDRETMHARKISILEPKSKVDITWLLLCRRNLLDAAIHDTEDAEHDGMERRCRIVFKLRKLPDLRRYGCFLQRWQLVNMCLAGSRKCQAAYTQIPSALARLLSRCCARAQTHGRQRSPLRSARGFFRRRGARGGSR